MSSGDNRGSKLIAIVLSIVILPLLVVTAFYASLGVAPTDSPLFRLGFTLPNNYAPFILTSVTTINVNETITSFFTNTAATQVQQVSPQLFPSIPSTDLTFLAIVLFGIAALGLVYNIRISRRRNLEFLPLEEGSNQKQEIAKILDLTISKSREGQEYRKTVLECYKMICDVLERKSTIEGRMLTAREFKELVSKRLDLNSKSLDRLTDLFEVARYSESEVTKSEAEACDKLF